MCEFFSKRGNSYQNFGRAPPAQVSMQSLTCLPGTSESAGDITIPTVPMSAGDKIPAILVSYLPRRTRAQMRNHTRMNLPKSDAKPYRSQNARGSSAPCSWSFA